MNKPIDFSRIRLALKGKQLVGFKFVRSTGAKIGAVKSGLVKSGLVKSGLSKVGLAKVGAAKI
jgi:hypothetical protein